MMWQALASVRDLGRLQDIAAILIRYGFGDLVRRMGLANALERTGRALHWQHADEYAHMPPPVRVRHALEELGPTFVKLGQLLATRVDQFEPDWIKEFSQLQDHAPAAPWDAVYSQLCEDLGAPPEHIFVHFSREALAAASIAQVHRARLADGSEVVVKVLRPGIRPIIDADLRWLGRLADLAERESPELRAFRPSEIVREFARSLHQELDLSEECRNAERIAANFEGYTDLDATGQAGEAPIIVIPRVHWQWTSQRLCVQDFIDGLSGRQLDALAQAGLDRRILARRGAQAVLKMIVQDGLFHADPHAGNVFYLPGNRVAFIDFGMVGRLTDERRDQLIGLLLGMVKRDARRVADVLLAWTDDATVDESAMMLEVQTFVDRYHGLALKRLNLGAMLNDVVGILRRHKVMLPTDLSMLVKAFVALEGMGRELDPDFDVATQARPLLEQALWARYAPATMARRGWRSASDLLSLITGLPQDLSRLLRAARRGRLEVHIEVTHLKQVGAQLNGAANRMAVGIVVAALIIGSSIVMTVPGGPTLLGLPLFGLLGFVCALMGGLWLLISIWRSGRMDP